MLKTSEIFVRNEFSHAKTAIFPLNISYIFDRSITYLKISFVHRCAKSYQGLKLKKNYFFFWKFTLVPVKFKFLNQSHMNEELFLPGRHFKICYQKIFFQPLTLVRIPIHGRF